LEQAHHALDTYFDYLKQAVSALTSGGTELGETLKHDGVENLTAMQEVANRLSKASRRRRSDRGVRGRGSAVS
jgi:hypothetical protein